MDQGIEVVHVVGIQFFVGIRKYFDILRYFKIFVAIVRRDAGRQENAQSRSNHGEF